MIRKKKNPNIDHYFKDLLIDTMYYGNPYNLVSVIIYYNQGLKCDDCGETFNDCLCEWCDDCKFQRCLCDLDYHDKEEVQKRAIQIAKKTLTKKQLKEVKNEVFAKLHDSGLSDEDYEFEKKHFKQLFS